MSPAARPAGVVIAGGGLAAQRCAETLRRCGWEGPVTIACAEQHRPYDRPPLSKEVLHDATAEERLAFRPEAWYEEKDVELLLGAPALALHPGARTVELGDGSLLRYEHLLIATGGAPRPLPALAPFANVGTLRDLSDAQALRGALSPGARLLVVGAGFIGQEVAAAAAAHGADVTIVEAAPLPLSALLGEQIGGWFADLHRARGVSLRLGEQVTAVEGQERLTAVTLAGGERLEVDHAVVGVGIAPATGWLAGSGLAPGHVLTDPDGRTELPCVYAAGDASATFDPQLGEHVPGSHWEAAGREGAAAARAMLGLEPARPAPASFWSDIHGTRVQYLGHARIADAVSIDGDPTANDFTATFTREGRPVAVLLAGRPHELPAARTLLTTPN